MKSITKYIFIFLVVCTFVPVSNASAGENDSLKSNDSHISKIRVLSKFTDSGLIAGYLTDITGDTVVINSRKGDFKYSLWDLSYIKIDQQRGRGGTVFFSSLIGIYYGYIIAFRAEGNPALFYSPNSDDNNLGELFATFIFGGLGSVAGYIFKTDSDDDFQIRNDERSIREVAEDLERILRKRRKTPEYHISFSGGFVYTMIGNSTEDKLNDAGAIVYDFENNYWMNNEKIQNATNLNMIRRIALSHNISKNYDIGLALVNAGEPVLFGGDTSGWLIRQDFKSTNLYLTGSRYLLNNKSNRLYAGIGIGLMFLDFHFYSEKYDMDIYDYIVFEDKIKKTKPSLYLFSGFDIMLDEVRSIGVGFDYVIGPSYHINGNPEFGYSGQDHRFGNASITISLGIHLK